MASAWCWPKSRPNPIDLASHQTIHLQTSHTLPLPASHPDRQTLDNAARTCPVHHSIHPDIEVAMNWA